ncbi:MAG: acyl-CoA thioesterase [Porcipelethomonas sp.]
MKKISEYERSPFYYETDRMGIIHHSNYIRWFEEARIEFMKDAGYPYDKMEEAGIMMPVLSAQCSYKSSVRFGDTVVIRTSISSFNGFKMELEYQVYDKGSGVLRSEGSTTHCFTDMEMKPVRIRKTHPEIFEIFDSISGDD